MAGLVNDMLLADLSVYLLHILTLEGKVLIVYLLLAPTSLACSLEVMNSPSLHQPSCHHLEIPTAVICCLQHTVRMTSAETETTGKEM